MSAVAFDNTMLSILLNPDGQIPEDKDTKQPVTNAKLRAEHIVALMQKANRKIIIPTPASAELLTAIGPDAQQYNNIIARSRRFELASFDPRCAIELALLNRGIFAADDKRDKAEPYQKVKVDRQIIAICKVFGVAELYTDDSKLAKRARMCGITPVSIAEVELPPINLELPFDPHDDMLVSEGHNADEID